MGGALLIAGRFVPLALVVLEPIVVNIAFFHVVLAPALSSVVMIVGAQVYLAWVYRDAFAGVLESRPIVTEPMLAAGSARQPPAWRTTADR